MARAVGEIEREILALSTHEKETLLNVLISDLDVPYDEMRLLAIQLNDATERSGRALEAAVARLEQFDEEMRRVRLEAREAVLRSRDVWPFDSSSSISGQ